jgi:hypothetical protein
MATKALYIQYGERPPHCEPEEKFNAFLLTLRCARHYKNDPVYCLQYDFLPDGVGKSVVMQAQKNAVCLNSLFDIEVQRRDLTGMVMRTRLSISYLPAK